MRVVAFSSMSPSLPVCSPMWIQVLSSGGVCLALVIAFVSDVPLEISFSTCRNSFFNFVCKICV